LISNDLHLESAKSGYLAGELTEAQLRLSPEQRETLRSLARARFRQETILRALEILEN